MTTATVNYAASAGITCTVTSLANGGYRCSAAVSNATNKYMDALLTASIQVGNVSSGGAIEIYAYGSIDGGTVYSGGLNGTDETITWGTTPSTSSILGYNQLPLIGVATTASTDDSNDIEFGPFSVGAAFGGALPVSWGIVVLNDTGLATNATGTNNSFDYVGIKYDAA